MKYPNLAVLPTSRSIVDVFGGYNHNLRIGDGEFYDMTNLSSDNYPVLSPRPQRGIYARTENPQGMVSKDTLCYVEGSKFVINGYPVEMDLSTEEEDCPKTLISMGSYVIIMPDKKWVNTVEKDGEKAFEFGNIEASVTTPTGTPVTFELCKTDGVGYENVVSQAEAPTDPQNMALWIDTSSTPHALKQYSSTSAMWVTIATTHIKISAPGIGELFEEGDGVTISGITVDTLSDLNASMVVRARGENFLVVTGILDEVTTQDTPITVKRQMPEMDFILESGNRLWGCKYGIALNGAVVNEIYASKLGDFKNWNCFAGISTDSYVASVGTDGQFTGAITHLGYPLFFKENCVHKVYGNYPANYQIQTTTCRGVQRGCSKSLAIVNEVLYYKSRSAICAYDGSLPMEISKALGDVSYSDAVAGSLGNKYYVSMMDASGEYHLFVYDTMRGMWHREDDLQAVEFCNCRGDLYFIDYADMYIKTVRGTGDTETAPIKWSAVTGTMGADFPDKKYVSRMDVVMSLNVGTRVSLYVEYDSRGEWEHLFTMTGTKLGNFAVPIRAKRCDHMRLKIIGDGDAKIYSICKTTEQGSDV